MKKVVILMLIVAAALAADPLDCSILIFKTTDGQEIPGYSILHKCEKDPIEVFQNWLNKNQPGKSAVRDFVISFTDNATKFMPKH